MKSKNLFGEVDLLHGSILRGMALFTIPLLISRIFQQLYNTVDTMIVGNYLGETALAAMGAGSVIYDLLVGFSMGIGNGLATVTARSFGTGDRELLKRSTAASMVIGFGFAILLSAIGSPLLLPLLRLLRTPEEIVQDAYTYLVIITASIVVTFAYNLGAGLLRAIGNSMMPLVFLIFSSVLNVILDIYFITGLHLGIRGTAWATVMAQGISAVLCVVYIWKKAKILIPRKKHFPVERILYKEMLGQGLSMGFMSSIVSLGTVILQYGINGLGYLVIAGHTAARKIYMFFNVFFSATGMAVSTFVSQNRGADQKQRIRKVLRVCYFYDGIAAAIVSAILWLFAEPMIRLISGSAEKVVIHNGTIYLQILAPFYGVLGALSQSRHALQGLGEKTLPLISSVIELIGKILFVLFLIPRFRYMAVIFCEPLIWCVMTTQLLYSLYHAPYMRKAEIPVLNRKKNS